MDIDIGIDVEMEREMKIEIEVRSNERDRGPVAESSCRLWEVVISFSGAVAH